MIGAAAPAVVAAMSLVGLALNRDPAVVGAGGDVDGVNTEAALVGLFA